MKSIIMFCFSLLISIGSYASFVPCATHGDSIGLGGRAQGCAITCSDYGLRYYIPTENSPIVKVKIYYHIFQDGINNFEQGNAAHEAYLKGIHKNINSSILSSTSIQQVCGDADPSTPSCDPNYTGDVSIDTRIRLELDSIVWYNNLDGTYNQGGICNSYTYEQYVATNPAFDDGLNVIFINVPLGGGGGCGLSRFLTINSPMDRYREGEPWAERSNLMHEIGHVLGLPHAWINCNQDYNCSNIPTSHTGCYNQLMGYNGAQTYISPNEVAMMRRTLLSNERAMNWVIGGAPEKEILTVTNDLTLSNDLTWYGDIVVEAGAVLTVPSNRDLRVAEGSKIVVKRGAKLIVDGGLITSCRGLWQGIFVEGTNGALSGQLSDPFAPSNANFAGTVIVQNGGTIEYAVDGITCRSTHVSWPATKSYWGGLIYCNDANFQFCNRAVEIFKNDVEDDRSTFIDSDFRDCEHGVTIWSSDGVEFVNCLFNNISHAGIGPLNSEIQIFGNTFRNSGLGIDISASRMNDHNSRIGTFGQVANRFENVEIGILCKGVNNTAPLLIENNIFEGCTVGIRHDGQSYFRTSRNDFQRTTYGTSSYGTGGSRDNIIDLNYHFRNYVCHTAVNENPGLTIVDNCLSSVRFNSLMDTPFDIFLYKASINNNQGEAAGKSAGNCFSPSYTSGSLTIFPNIYAYDSDNFSYHVTGSASQPCTSAPNPSGNRVPGDVENYNLLFNANFNSTEDCGSEFAPPPPSGIICISGGTESEIKSRIIGLEAEVAALEGLPGVGILEERYSKQRCLEYNTASLFDHLINNQSYTSAANFFAQRTAFESKLLGFDALVTGEDYPAARTYLDNLSPSVSENQELKFARGLMLDFLEEGPEYQPTQQQQTQLYDAGLTDHASRGPVRSIYEFLTDEKMPYGLLPPPPRSKERQATPPVAKKQGFFYPNPTNSNSLFISEAGAEMQSLSIIDTHGRVLESFNAEQLADRKISLANIPVGVYWVTMTFKDNRSKTQKLLKF